jgi:hypothetical protein
LPPFVKRTDPFLHWYVRPVPVAATDIETDPPAQEYFVVAGCVVIATAVLTIRLAEEDVTDPQGEVPVTTNVYPPAEALVTLLKFKVGVKAPETSPPSVRFIPDRLHW